jgi:hypothetical protein
MLDLSGSAARTWAYAAAIPHESDAPTRNKSGVATPLGGVLTSLIEPGAGSQELSIDPYPSGAYRWLREVHLLRTRRKETTYTFKKTGFPGRTYGSDGVSPWRRNTIFVP